MTANHHSFPVMKQLTLTLITEGQGHLLLNGSRLPLVNRSSTEFGGRWYYIYAVLITTPGICTISTDGGPTLRYLAYMDMDLLNCPVIIDDWAVVFNATGLDNSFPEEDEDDDGGLSETVVAVIVSLASAIFLVIACILAFVLHEVVCKPKCYKNNKVAPYLDS